MTRQKFNSLSKKAKKHTLLSTGVFLTEREFGIFRMMLYQVDAFYTEVIFLKWSKNVIGFRSFSSTENLNPYLQQINISNLMQEVMH